MRSLSKKELMLNELSGGESKFTEEGEIIGATYEWMYMPIEDKFHFLYTIRFSCTAEQVPEVLAYINSIY